MNNDSLWTWDKPVPTPQAPEATDQSAAPQPDVSQQAGVPQQSGLADHDRHWEQAQAVSAAQVFRDAGAAPEPISWEPALEYQQYPAADSASPATPQLDTPQGSSVGVGEPGASPYLPTTPVQPVFQAPEPRLPDGAGPPGVAGQQLHSGTHLMAPTQPLRTVEPTAAVPVAQNIRLTPPAAGVHAAPPLPRSAQATGEMPTGETPSAQSLSLHTIMQFIFDSGASDLHLTVDSPPMMRIDGELVCVPNYPVLTAEVLQAAMYKIMSVRQREHFEEHLEADFAVTLPGACRFRVNVFRQMDAVAAVLRVIPSRIRTLEELGAPEVMPSLAGLPRGLVLVTGATASGKSTTLAALIDLMNRDRSDHIITIEDPIEFVHSHKKCLVNQREVGQDTKKFATALRQALRQDPDIILVGEMRDLETISTALTAAETGHLVLGTLHTSTAPGTIERVVDVFPPNQQQQVRVMLANSLQAVICQTLIKKAGGGGRVLAAEVMVCTPAIRALIREGKTHQIYSAMQSGSQFGMHTLDQHLVSLVKTGKITYESALEKCVDAESFAGLSSQNQGW